MGASVTRKTPEELEGHRLFVDKTGGTGLTIGPNGEIGGLFKHKGKAGGRSAVGETLADVLSTVQPGEVWAESYATKLPELYVDVGLRPVSRTAFNDKFKPEGWDYDLYRKWQDGRPDILFYVYDPEPVFQKKSKTKKEGKPHPYSNEIRESLPLRDWDGAESIASAWAPGGEVAAGEERFALAPPTDSPEFRRWFGDSKVVDENGEPLVVYHGTTHHITSFAEDRGNIENHLGIAHYFTDSADDAVENYAAPTGGPDLTARIEQRAERIAFDEDLEYDDPAVVARARRELIGPAPSTLPVYLQMENPLHLHTTDEGRIYSEMDLESLSDLRPQAVDRVKEEEGIEDGEDFDAEDYQVEIEQALIEIANENYYEIESRGPLQDLVDAHDRIRHRFDDTEQLDEFWAERRWDGDHEDAGDFFDALRDAAVYVTQGEYGDHASGQYIRELVEAAGYDGVIMDASRAFGAGRDIGKPMEHVEGARHYVVFEPEQIKSATGNVGTFDPADPDIRYAIPSGATVLKAAKASIRKNLHAVGNLPKKAFDSMIRRDGAARGEVQAMTYALGDFEKAMRAAYGKNPNEQQIRLVDRALHGSPAAVSQLPKELRLSVRAMRNHVDTLSRRMIDEGVIEGIIRARFTHAPQGQAANEAVAEAKDKIRTNLGAYLTRSYQVFDDPKWAEKVPADVRNKAKAYIRTQYKRRTGESAEAYDERLEGTIDALLYEGKAADSPIAVLAQSKLGAKDLSILKKRKDIAPEIRALWGEYSDPRVNYARSVTKMAHLIANHQFLEQVRAEGKGVWLFDQPRTTKQGSFKKKIAAEGSAVMAPLNGLYTTPEIVQAFEEATTEEQLPTWLQYYLQANSAVKFAKTIASPMTHVRNLIGNAGFALANGHTRVDLARMSARIVKAKNAPQFRDYVRSAIEAGVLHESARAGELYDVLKDVQAAGVGAWQEKTLRAKLNKALAWGAEVYQLEDDLWKLYAWENEKARYGKARPDLSEMEVARMAAEIVRNTYPTYSLVPRAIRKLRRFPLMGTFVSFPWEVMRVTGNTMRLMAQEMRSDNAAVRAIGRKRLAGMSLAAVGTTAAAQASMAMMGLTGDDDDDARLFLAPWDRNSDLIWLGQDDEGNRQYVNVSYTDPYSYLKKPLLAFSRGEAFDTALVEASLELLEPFFGEEILAQSIIDVLRNSTDTGGRVYTPEDSWNQIVEDIAVHVAEPFKPGAVTSAERIVKGLTDYVEPYGRSYDPTIESLAVVTGVRRQTLNIPQALTFRGRDYSSSLGRVTGGLSSVAGRRGTVTEDELREAYETAENSRRELFDDMHRTARAALALGVSEEEVLGALSSSMSREKALSVLRGSYIPYRPSGNFLASRSKGAPADVAQMYRERRAFIQGLAAEVVAQL